MNDFSFFNPSSYVKNVKEITRKPIIPLARATFP
jgi:hypothetical protein